MGLESFHTSETSDQPFKMEFGEKYASLVPLELRQDPLGYFERLGTPMKSGEKKYDKEGSLRDDPGAVRQLPDWEEGDRVVTPIAKWTNREKSMLKETGEPLYEYNLLSYIQSLGLPAPKPIGFFESEQNSIFLMEKVDGYTKKELDVAVSGWSAEDIHQLKQDTEREMVDLQNLFLANGLQRSWKANDMIFQIDFVNRRLVRLIPTDFERTRVLVMEPNPKLT
ncbi:MAG: hypothetical protein NUW02_03100 [Candidatus Campbellbacteria bacterium]|nr:hypothetical protein [Candidatus Campbellbacteria bacterium]